MKRTAIAPSNIAFVKYWGRKDEVLRLPENGSISMNLSNLLTTTTVEFSKDFKKDLVIYNGKEEITKNRAIQHINRIRKLAGITNPVKIVTKNNFPGGTGLSSSASGFAALSLAGAVAAGLELSQKELSILARQGSGSACRSIPDGFVEWLDGNTTDSSYAKILHEPDYWDIVDVVAIVSEEMKEVSTSEGQKTAKVNPFFAARRNHMKSKIKEVKKYLREKDFKKLGELIESEALELHAIFLTSGLLYLLPETLSIMKFVRQWRKDGLPVYFTINTGQNIHLICEKKDEKKVVLKLNKLPFVKQVISNKPSIGVRLSTNHLF